MVNNEILGDFDESILGRVMSQSLLSIITPCLNRAGFIDNVIINALSQKYPFEHIIMDGGSTDGTLEKLRKYDHLIISSGPDGGIYDAINKGIKQSRGEIIGVLNTDDTYEPAVFQKVVRIFQQNPGIEMVWGGADEIVQNPNGSEEQYRVTYPLRPPNFFYKFLNESPNFNACFFRRSVFSKYGLLNTKWQIVSDLEFMLRLVFQGCNFLRRDEIFYHYHVHPGSLTFGGAASKEDYLSELCQVVEQFLSVKSIPDEAIHPFKTMHTNWCLLLGRYSFEHGEFASAFQQLRIAKKYNSEWFKIFIKKLFHRSSYVISQRFARLFH